MTLIVTAEPEQNQAQPNFYLGKIPIYGKLILAPMDGICDPTFRWMARKLGSAYSVSEFISALDYSVQKRYQINRLKFRDLERPFGFQLLDNDPVRIAEVAAGMEEDFHPDFFDINMGCSTHRVLSRGAGSGLMRSPELIGRIFKAVTSATALPVSGKIRLGWNDTELRYNEVADQIVSNGGCLLAVHGRTAKMAFNGHARWEPIAELKQRLPIPVIGNGDVATVEDAQRMLETTGCDAVMIGRVAKANPWIFSWRNRNEITAEEVWQLSSYQVSEMLRTYPEDAAIMAFRKFFKAYMGPMEVDANKIRELLVIRDETEFLSAYEAAFQTLGVDTAEPNPWFSSPKEFANFQS